LTNSGNPPVVRPEKGNAGKSRKTKRRHRKG